MGAGEYTYDYQKNIYMWLCVYIHKINSLLIQFASSFFSMVNYTCTQWVLSSQPHPSSTLVGVPFEPKLIGWLIKSLFIIHQSGKKTSFIFKRASFT